jgi:hypothetical protein
MTTNQPTYHSADFRTYPGEWLRHRGDVELLMVLCETLEDGRWEGFTSIHGARRNGQKISIREALGR